MLNANELQPSQVEIAQSDHKPKRHSYFVGIFKRLLNHKGALVGMIIITLMVLMAVFAPLLTLYSYSKIDIMNAYAGFSKAHLLGTDELGHDTLTRIMYGARYSLSIALLSTLISVVGGIIFGSIAGYFGGFTDNIIMRVFDVIQSVPGILLSIIIAIVLGNGPINLMIALAIGPIPGYARILRAQILSIRKLEYLEAATATNCNIPRIILRYVVPNAWSPLIVQASLGVPGQILATSSLAFIGLGIQPPTPEWGAMLSAGKEYIRNYPILILIPGIFIMITVLALNMIGDGLRDMLDPKLKH